MQELQLDGGLIPHNGNGEEQRLGQVAVLQQLEPVAWRRWPEPWRKRVEKIRHSLNGMIKNVDLKKTTAKSNENT